MGWLSLVVVVVLGVPAAAYLAQDRMLFLPRLAVPPTAMRPPRPVEEIVFAAADGPQVRGWLAPARDGGPAPLPEVDPTRIVLVGRSLGAGVATQVAAQRPVQGVVLVSPYDSMVALAQHHYPYLPARWPLRHRFDSIARGPGIKAPLLAIAGDRDTVIPLERSRLLHEAWGEPKRWVLIADAGHDDLGLQREFWGPIRAFLDTARAG